MQSISQWLLMYQHVGGLISIACLHLGLVAWNVVMWSRHTRGANLEGHLCGTYAAKLGLHRITHANYLIVAWIALIKVLFFLDFLVFFVASLALIFGVLFGHRRSSATRSTPKSTVLLRCELTSLVIGLVLLLNVGTSNHGSLIPITITRLLVVKVGAIMRAFRATRSRMTALLTLPWLLWKQLSSKVLESSVWHWLSWICLLIRLLCDFTALILFQIITDNLRALEIVKITFFYWLRKIFKLVGVVYSFLTSIFMLSLPNKSRRAMLAHTSGPYIIHTLVKALSTLVRTWEKITLVMWELITILGTHLGASHEHSLVHFALFSETCVILESIHACLLQNVLHHALPRSLVDLSLWLCLLLLLYLVLLWFFIFTWKLHTLRIPFILNLIWISIFLRFFHDLYLILQHLAVGNMAFLRVRRGCRVLNDYFYAWICLSRGWNSNNRDFITIVGLPWRWIGW